MMYDVYLLSRSKIWFDRAPRSVDLIQVLSVDLIDVTFDLPVAAAT